LAWGQVPKRAAHSIPASGRWLPRSEEKSLLLEALQEMARGKKVEVAASDFFVHRNLGIRDTAGMVAAAKLEEVCNDLAFIDQATR
jgi:hypothetical protein